MMYAGWVQADRIRYAWVLVRYGGWQQEAADAASVEQYPYEPAGTPWRHVVFHHAWHWAMCTLHGVDYPRTHPELLWASEEFVDLSWEVE